MALRAISMRRLVALDLFERRVEHAQRLLGLEPAGIIVLGDEDGEEQRAEAAFLGAREVELAVRLALADVAAVVEDAIDGVHMPVEDMKRCWRARARRTSAARSRAAAAASHRGGIRHIIGNLGSA